MVTITELQDRRNRLLIRLESLQKRVSHGDKTVEFDLDQVSNALDLLDREITKSGNRRIARHIRIRSKKDL